MNIYKRQNLQSVDRRKCSNFFFHYVNKYSLLPTVSEGWGNVMFSVCSQGEGVPTPQPRYLPPHPGQDRGEGGTPRYLFPPAKVPTPRPSRSGQGGKEVPQGTYPPPPRQGSYPHPGHDGGGGIPRYLPPPAKVPNPPPSRSGWGRGYPKVPTPPAKVPTPPHPLPG